MPMPGLDGVARGVELDRSPRQPDRPGVGPVEPGEDVGQRGLAGAVLAEEGVDLAGPHLEVDVVVGDHPAGEALGDAGRDDRRGTVAPAVAALLGTSRGRAR